MQNYVLLLHKKKKLNFNRHPNSLNYLRLASQQKIPGSKSKRKERQREREGGGRGKGKQAPRQDDPFFPSCRVIFLPRARGGRRGYG